MTFEVIATSGGINWCWYHRFEIDGDKAKEVWANRYHRYELRGDTPPETSMNCEFPRNPSAEWLAELGFKPKTEIVAIWPDGGEVQWFELTGRAN